MKRKAFYKMRTSKATTSFRTGKGPGDDGFPPKYCAAHQDGIGPIQQAAFQQIEQNKLLQSISLKYQFFDGQRPSDRQWGAKDNGHNAGIQAD